jgi:hypothetical protein
MAVTKWIANKALSIEDSFKAPLRLRSNQNFFLTNPARNRDFSRLCCLSVIYDCADSFFN